MNTAETHNHETVLGIVRQWSDEERIAFIQEILQTFLSKKTDAPRKQPTLHLALGIARVASPPNDEEVKEWLDEHRQEKYG